MAIDEKTLNHILEYLDGEIKVIEKSHVTLDLLEEENIFTDATKHRIQIAVEMVINIAEHIVAGFKLGQPEHANDLFPLIAKEGIIGKELAGKLSKAVGLRNILVHQYLEVSLTILADSTTSGLNDLRDFARAIHDFLKKQKTVPNP